MGTITRHANAPFTDGEAATDTSAALEADFATIYAEFNGVIANANVKAAANISGTKLLDGTVSGIAVVANTITLDSIAESAVPKHYFTTGAGTITVAGDFPGVTAAVLTPGSINDMIFMDLTGTYGASAQPIQAGEITLGWHVDGTEYDNVVKVFINSFGIDEQPFHSSYAVIAPRAASMTIKPIWGGALAGKTVSTDVQFRCFILPGKA